ncbi:MAG: hypothetical protein JW731_16555 [Bacteroidales bacterium]|nr:hypothetical protein [Bacteroidales bacterium]
MDQYLIEIPHTANKSDCDRAIRVFKESGSHLLTHADWGCMDGVHKAWFIAEVENKEQALNIIPPLFKKKANIVRLMKLASVEDTSSDKFHHE